MFPYNSNFFRNAKESALQIIKKIKSKNFYKRDKYNTKRRKTNTGTKRCNRKKGGYENNVWKKYEKLNLIGREIRIKYRLGN